MLPDFLYYLLHLPKRFASVTVLDDASTDHTRDVVARFPNVRYVRALRNGGTVAAKNLILKQPPPDGWILFLDSEMEVLTDDVPAQLAACIGAHPKLGAGAGRIVGADGAPTRFNRGYDLAPLRMLLGGIGYALAQLTQHVPLLGAAVRSLAAPFTMDVHDPLVPEQADWVIEACFFVRTDLFVQYGGFDSRYVRFHEGPDFCLTLRRRGYQVWYVPTVVVRNTDQHTGGTLHRAYHRLRSHGIYLWKHPSRLVLWKYPRP